MEGFDVFRVKTETRACVILDRQEDGQPGYEVVGAAHCVMCQKPCWLGANTARVVMAGEAMPMCMPCGKGVVDPEKYIGNVGD